MKGSTLFCPADFSKSMSFSTAARSRMRPSDSKRAFITLLSGAVHRSSTSNSIDSLAPNWPTARSAAAYTSYWSLRLRSERIQCSSDLRDSGCGMKRKASIAASLTSCSFSRSPLAIASMVFVSTIAEFFFSASTLTAGSLPARAFSISVTAALTASGLAGLASCAQPSCITITNTNRAIQVRSCRPLRSFMLSINTKIPSRARYFHASRSESRET